LSGRTPNLGTGLAQLGTERVPRLHADVGIQAAAPGIVQPERTFHGPNVKVFILLRIETTLSWANGHEIEDKRASKLAILATKKITPEE
jgi:hypothetical protein